MVSLLLIASSMSVGFTAFAAEGTSLVNWGSEAIVKNDAEIGTATHYDNYWNPQKNWEAVHALAGDGEDVAKLNFKNVGSAIHTHTGSGVYTSTPSASYKMILEKNGVKDNGDGSYSYVCESGTFFSAEVKTLYSCSNADTHAEGEDCDSSCTSKANVVTKQYGWDKDGYYYYDYYNEDGYNTPHAFGEKTNSSSVKLRDKSVKHPHSYETYTYEFPRGTVLKDVVLANSNSPEYRSSYYEIYATKGKQADLYNPENRIAVYDGVEEKSNNAFASHYTFNEPIEATYVGLKLIDPLSSVRTALAGTYYTAARIWMLKFYGTEGVEKHSSKTGAVDSVQQTTASEDNYSIPEKLHEDDASYSPQHIYYRNGIPTYAGAMLTAKEDQNGDGIEETVDARYRLWDRKANQDVLFDGRETYKEGDALEYYDDTHTELFYDFGAIYDINEIIFANNTNEKSRASDFTFYASNNFEDLFTPANELSYVETNVAAVSVKTIDLKARYVGISFQDTCWGNASYPADDYLRVCEFDVMGKYSGESQVATVKNFADYTSALAAVAGKQSVVASVPEDYAMVKGERKEGAASNESLARLYNNNLAESDINDYALAHTDAEGNYVYGPDVYTAFKYDLKLSRKITDVFLGNHSNSYYQTCAYKVYVSDDAAIDESDMVAQVTHAGRGDECNVHATLISLPEGTGGRYVEVRIFMPQKMCSEGQAASNIYYRLMELNIFGDMGYTLKGDTYTSRESYFTKNAENIDNSLIANTPFYKTENITNVNFGKRDTNTSKIYYDMKSPSNEDWTEASKSFTETTYYDVDGDLGGVTYTYWNYSCSGGREHAEGCNKSCEKTVEVIDDGSVYQTVIYKLPAKAEISEVDIYHSPSSGRLTSHYMISFAEKEADLFGENATNIEVANIYYYNLVKLNEPVTAKFFAVKLLCGVQSNITSADYNYGRMGHFALVGKSLACDDDAHTWEEVIDKAATCTETGSKHNECTFCGYEETAIEIPALGHDMQPNSDKTMLVCANDCGEEVEACVVTFLGKNDELLKELVIKKGTALSAEEVNAIKAPIIYGYNFVSWGKELEKETIEESVTFKPTYARDTETTYNVTVDDKTSIDVVQPPFDTRVTLTNENAKYWTVNGVILTHANANGVGKFYVSGDMEITTHTEDDARLKETAVGLLSDAEIVNENKGPEHKHSYAVFAHLHNGANHNIVEVGVTFISGTKYNQLTDEEKANNKFWQDKWSSGISKVKLDGMRSNYMITLNGISTTTENLKRYAQAYVKYRDADGSIKTIVSTNEMYGLFNVTQQTPAS